LNVYMQVVSSSEELSHDLLTKRCLGPASRTRSDLGKSLRGTASPK